MPRILLQGALIAAAFIPACSEEQPLQAVLVIHGGQEPDTFSAEPVPAALYIDAVSASGSRTTLLQAPWPTQAFDLGSVDPAADTAFEASCTTDTGDIIIWGRSPVFHVGALAGLEIPLFVGRTNRTSRPSGSMSIHRRKGVADVVMGEFLVHAGGTAVIDATGASIPSSTVGTYDLAFWEPSVLSPQLPRTPASMAIVAGRYALLIDAAGATWYDFGTGEQAEATAPDGMRFADVSGGRVIAGDSGEAYVVGATRLDAPATAAVLRVGDDLTLGRLDLVSARAGAAATWIPGHGLAVAGGSATGAGIEILSPGGSGFRNLAFAPVGSSGMAAVAIGSAQMLVAGGLDELAAPSAARVADITCTASCAWQTLGVAAEEVAMQRATGYVVGADEVLLIGDHANATRVVYLSALSTHPVAADVALREPRRDAVSAAVQGQLVAILGGVDAADQPVRSVEVFIGGR